MDHNVIRPRRNIHPWVYPTSYPLNKIDQSSYSKEIIEFDDKYNQEYLSISGRSYNNYDKADNKVQNKKQFIFSTKAVQKYIGDYFEGSSLHGLRYVGAEHISLFERLFWIISFFGAMCFAAFFISNIYNRWVYNPIIVAINPEYKEIFNIPFPAITICNMNQALKVEAEKVLKGNDNNEKWLLDDICNWDNNNSITNTTNLHILQNWDYIKNFILKISQPCTDLLVQCKWRGFEIPCQNILNSALTDEGVCCTFNRVDSKYLYHNPWTIADFNISFPPNNINWTPENGYPKNATNNTWPYRAVGAGAHLGLALIINVAASEYYCSSTSSVGLKIRLHSPVESPMMADYGFILHPRKEVRVAIRPSMDEASPTITRIPITQRQCFFSVEKELYYYRTYTKMNCDLECLSNYTLEICKCVPYYLPKNRDTPICDKTREHCFRKAKTDMDIELRSSVYCNCLPACNEISYAQDHSLGDISEPKLRKGAANEVEPDNLIILHVFYQFSQFRSYQKSEIFGFTEFLSNSGGLLGLFLGFSFLSAVEIFYHLTLRLWCTYYRRHKKQEKSIIVYPFTQ